MIGDTEKQIAQDICESVDNSKNSKDVVDAVLSGDGKIKNHKYWLMIQRQVSAWRGAHNEKVDG